MVVCKTDPDEMSFICEAKSAAALPAQSREPRHLAQQDLRSSSAHVPCAASRPAATAAGICIDRFPRAAWETLHCIPMESVDATLEPQSKEGSSSTQQSSF